MHIVCHKHRDIFPRDDECEHAQYDDECERAQYDDECECTQYDDEGVHEAHDIRGFADLQTSQISLTRGSRGVQAPWGFKLARMGRV